VERKDHQETMVVREMLVKMELQGTLDQEDLLVCKDSMDHLDLLEDLE